MPGFVIMSVFEVSPGRVPLGADVLAREWGRGHRFSYCDGRTLTLVVEISAADARTAFEATLMQAESVWSGCGYGTLDRTVTMRLQEAVPDPPVAERLLPGSRASSTGRRKRTRVARQLKFFAPGEPGP